MQCVPQRESTVTWLVGNVWGKYDCTPVHVVCKSLFGSGGTGTSIRCQDLIVCGQGLIENTAVFLYLLLEFSVLSLWLNRTQNSSYKKCRLAAFLCCLRTVTVVARTKFAHCNSERNFADIPTRCSSLQLQSSSGRK